MGRTFFCKSNTCLGMDIAISFTKHTIFGYANNHIKPQCYTLVTFCCKVVVPKDYFCQDHMTICLCISLLQQFSDIVSVLSPTKKQQRFLMNHTEIMIDSTVSTTSMSPVPMLLQNSAVLANVCEDNICIQMQLRIKSRYTHWSRLKYFYFSFHALCQTFL